MTKCKDCKYWNQHHSNDGYMGCELWNKYKHLGRKPYSNKGDIQCPQCNHEIILHPEQYDSNKEYEEAKDAAFTYDINNSGLTEIFEGWVGKSRLVNNSIITKAEDNCKHFKSGS